MSAKEPDYKRLFESAAGLIVVVDTAFRILAASDAYLRATMSRREAIVGKELFAVFPYNSAEVDGSGVSALRASFERVLATGSADAIPCERYDIARPAALGGGFDERYWSVLSTPVPAADGAVAWIVAGVQDITDFVRRRDGGTAVSPAEREYALDIGARKRAEQAQRESEERYRTLFQSIDAGFCVIEMIYDAQGKPVDYRFLEVNPAFERQTGLKSATRKTVREHDPEHEQHWFDIYAHVAQTGEPVRFVDEARALPAWFDVYAYRVGGPGSRRVGVLFNDITERVRAAEALKEADRRKGEFIATLAHELRNPLAPMRNAVSILQLKAPPQPELQGARDVLHRQLGHLARLVDDLLDVSRITFGKVELHRERLDLRTVAEEAVSASRPLLEEAGHRLAVRLPREPVSVDGDRVRLAQVISHLLDNAARYTPSGGEIALEVTAANDAARVMVQDNGIGIPPDMLSRIFETFAQVEPRSRAHHGVGIGLSLGRMLVQLHGGEVSAESDGPGRGARFTVRLPLAEAAGAQARCDPAPVSEVRRRVLVVDDNVDAACTQAELLRMLGHEVEAAYSGHEALRKAAQFRPEVVLLDLGMPGMDGFEVARRLRTMPEGREALLIAQTGWDQEEDRRRTTEAGFNAHLTKPVDVGILMETLARPGA